MYVGRRTGHRCRVPFPFIIVPCDRAHLKSDFRGQQQISQPIMALLSYLSILLIATCAPNAVARLARAEIENGMAVPSSETTSFDFLRRPDVVLGTSAHSIPSSRELYGAQWSWSNLFCTFSENPRVLLADSILT